MSDQSFVATLLFKSDSSDEGYDPLYYESIAIISANDLEQARARALALGGSGETAFTSVDNIPITWVFLELFDIRPTLEDGMKIGEVMARFFHDIDSYRLAFKS